MKWMLRLAYPLLLLLALPGFAREAAGAVPTEDLAGYWCFEGDVSDSSGNGNHGALSGGGFAAGRQGLAVELDGTDDLVSVPAASGLDFGPGDFSAALWIRRDSVEALQDLVRRGDTGCFQTGWGLAVLGSGVASFRRRVASCQAAAEGGVIDLDEWHFVAGIRRGNWDELYVDGMLVSVSGGPAGSPDTAAPLEIGGGPGAFFDGRIDELGVWRRALDSQEIQTLFAAGAGASLCVPGEIPEVPASGPWGQALLGLLLLGIAFQRLRVERRRRPGGPSPPAGRGAWEGVGTRSGH